MTDLHSQLGTDDLRLQGALEMEQSSKIHELQYIMEIGVLILTW